MTEPDDASAPTLQQQAPEPGQPEPPPTPATRARLPVVWISIAIGLTVVAIATIAILAAHKLSTPADTTPNTGPLAVPAVDQPGATGKYCTTVMAALPTTLSGLAQRALVDPTPGVRAWGDPAVVLRCGIPDPQELTCSAALYQINNVAWLVLTDGDATTYIAVDRPVRVAVTFTSDGGSTQRTGPIQQLSDVLAADLPPRDICSSGAVIPPDNG